MLVTTIKIIGHTSWTVHASCRSEMESFETTEKCCEFHGQVREKNKCTDVRRTEHPKIWMAFDTASDI